MSLISTHTAAGQMAGFLFQPERALFHLANSPAGSVVGIETLDDVAVLLPDGTTIYEQDKHSVSKRSPLAENKVEIWKTLNIWLAAIAAEEIELTSAELHLVTNQVVSSGFARELIVCGRQRDDLAHLVALLRQAGQRVPKSVRETADFVLSRGNAELAALLERVHVIDGSQSSSADDLKKSLATKLPLPADHEVEILQSLLGWIHDTAIELIRKREPAWLTREAFVERYLVLVSAFHDRRFLNETAEALIPVSTDKRLAHRHRLFVKQLLWLGFPEDDEQLIEAIDDYIRSSSERIRLAKSGVATLADFQIFEERLTGRWKNIFRRAVTSLASSDEQEQHRSLRSAAQSRTP